MNPMTHLTFRFRFPLLISVLIGFLPLNHRASSDEANMPRLEFFYRATKLKQGSLMKRNRLEIAYDPGSYVRLGSVKYDLESVSFASPTGRSTGSSTAHATKGRVFELEARLTHRGPDGQKLILAALYEKRGSNPVIEFLLRTNKTRGTERFFNAIQLLPNPTENTPATESKDGTKWIIFSTIGSVSAEQTDAFRSLASSKGASSESRDSRDFNDEH